MQGKFIVIEGTDSSGKETQAKLLVKKLNDKNIKAEYISFPMYDTPTGKIVGGPYLGKKAICEGWFEETAVEVDPIVSSMYYTADRRYNFHKIQSLLDNGVTVICDRYCDSNMAHQAGKEKDKKKRFELYEKLDILEYTVAGLKKPDQTIFLHLPWIYSKKALELREESADQMEQAEMLEKAEKVYLEIAGIHNYQTIECLIGDRRKTIEELSEEIFKLF